MRKDAVITVRVSRASRPLAGVLRLGRVPSLADFRQVRSGLSSSLGRKGVR